MSTSRETLQNPLRLNNMIVSENIKLYINSPLETSFIEKALNERGINPLRWAIVSVEADCVNVSVSYVKKD